MLVTQRANDVIDQLTGIAAIAGANLFVKKVLNIFGQGNCHGLKLHFAGLIDKVFEYHGGYGDCKNLEPPHVGSYGELSKTFRLYDGTNLGTGRT